MTDGWIKLHRKIQDNKMWLEEPFTRGQAWVDLLMLANHDDGFIRVRGNRIDVHRGQVGWSQEKLAARWKWSRKKVSNFFRELEEIEHQIAQQKNNVSSVITILNYNLYQDKEQQKEQQRNGRRTAEAPQKNTNKNEKKEKNVKKTTSLVPEGDTPCPYVEIVAAYHEFCPTLPRVKALNETRKKYLHARWAEDEERQNIGWWQEFFGYVAKSKFLTGQVEAKGRDHPWNADFEWIITAGNFVKILEGKYE